MTTTKVDTQATQLKRGDGASPEVFTLVGQITDIQGPDGSATEIPISTLDSTAVEVAMGLMDEGSISLNMVLDPANAQQTGLRTDRTAKTLRNFKIVMTDGSATTLDFAAYVTGFSLDASGDEVWRASITLRISGAVAWS
jgi:hypothetical protein|tara:strand:- start:9103 stop:9522 length:420 start_codon:yes stop_codon:yes gene_type:complete